MYRFILFYFVLYICIYVAPWFCEARHLIPLYVHTCSGMTIKLNLNLNLMRKTGVICFIIVICLLGFGLTLVPFYFCKKINNYMLSLKDVICTYTHKSKMIECVVNFYILQGKYYIHKQKFAKYTPKCNLFLSEMDALKKSLLQINNKNNYILLDFMETFFP